MKSCPSRHSSAATDQRLPPCQQSSLLSSGKRHVLPWILAQIARVQRHALKSALGGTLSRYDRAGHALAQGILGVNAKEHALQAKVKHQND